MVQWEVHPDQRAEVFAAFASMDLEEYQSGGGPTIKTLGRWHDVINGRGLGIYETDDADALASWVLHWNLAVDFEIAIVHTDEEAHAMMREHLAGQD
jgi:hypothetical protein